MTLKLSLTASLLTFGLLLASLGHAQPGQSSFNQWVCATERTYQNCPETHPVPHNSLPYCFKADAGRTTELSGDEPDFIRVEEVRDTTPRYYNLGSAISTPVNRGSGQYLFSDGMTRNLQIVLNNNCSQ